MESVCTIDEEIAPGLAVLGTLWGANSRLGCCDCVCRVVSWVSGLGTVSSQIWLRRNLVLWVMLIALRLVLRRDEFISRSTYH